MTSTTRYSRPNGDPSVIAARNNLVVIGGGIRGASGVPFAGRGGMDVVLLERGASGTNAGTLTMQTTRAAPVPDALREQDMSVRAPEWLVHDVGVVARDGP